VVPAGAWDGALRAQSFLPLTKCTEQIVNVFANSVIEIQAFLVEIVGKFEITMTERSERVIRGSSSVMIPMVDGELEHGSQLPLTMSVAAREDDV
jgi:hypothetical protein